MTTTSVFRISFVSRAKKRDTESITIFCRINVNGKRTEFALIKDVPAKAWNQDKEKLTHLYKDYSRSNNYIDQVKAKLTNIYRELTLSEKTITPVIIKNSYLGTTQKGHTLSFLYDYHYKTQISILSSGTIAHYKTTIKYLDEFLISVKKMDDILINEIDYLFLTDFEAFLRSYLPKDRYTKMTHNVVMKHMTRLRKLLNLAIKLDWIQKNPFDRFNVTYTKVDRGYLTNQELETVMYKEIKIERLQFIRDLFVFSCYTGHAYIDVRNLKPDNIVLGIDGGQWIRTKRQKTKIPIQIPLLPIALDIVNRYKKSPKSIHNDLVFPPISNQKLNSYLKEIADCCSINKNLTFHLARHTFATTVVLGNGVPIETVSKILGHTKLSTTQIFARVLQDKISQDMSDLNKKLQNATND